MDLTYKYNIYWGIDGRIGLNIDELVNMVCGMQCVACGFRKGMRSEIRDQKSEIRN
jgi:hypothetical protein